MSYLLDKKVQRKKLYYGVFFLFIFLFLFYFRAGVWRGLSYACIKIFHPVLVVGDAIGKNFGSLGSYFISKSSLSAENQNLKAELDAEQATMANYNSILAENTDLKDTLGRKTPKVNMILAAILSKPNQSLYDTLVIDAGSNEGIKIGQIVFAFSSVPIGRITEVYPESSKVILFSNPGEKTTVVVTHATAGQAGKNISMELVGRGGGNFEMVMPSGVTFTPGDQVVLPGITPYVVGTVQTIISDPRDSFSKAILTSPVNIQELNFVEVEI